MEHNWREIVFKRVPKTTVGMYIGLKRQQLLCASHTKKQQKVRGKLAIITHSVGEWCKFLAE